MQDILKKLGIRATPQRLAILNLLEGNTTHPSAEEIYSKLKLDFPSLSLTTVYNTLEFLVNTGVLQEVKIDYDRRRFDPNPKPHYHFLCNKCRRVFDLDIYLPNFKIPQQVGNFLVEGYSINFYGCCEDCKKENNYPGYEK